ncbi:2-hydroxyacyl-CoA dehydratase family protein [Sphingomonas baiyangensis]|uniref:2-hydroxyacyl-CoA dehydratase n=1 Tax=Sphingomonas baiyangensis TaxID=2572576 RepID=A0A4V5PYL9_9SPHN|nr:2-hydroxyacyl-CoA dehydratase family protein [Sphingomonas baiyangensis]TKD51568.1 2-hydroxyacyl-CoA dehydratase [Sphingomonas baiyangensis]
MTDPQDKMVATVAAQAHQKATQARFREEVIEGGGDYVIADAVTPHEIFHTMDIPVISLAWYSAVIAAKRLSPYYFDLMDRLGYHDGLPRYGSLPFMTTLDGDPERAPYGGLPRPMLILERLRGDVGQKIGEQWAGAFDGVPLVALDSSSVSELRSGWHKRAQHDWEELYETPRLDFQTEQLRDLIAVTETLSHRTFDAAEFRAVMHRVNRAGELVDRAKRIIARTRPAPVALPEQLTNIMAATWSRGSQWAIDHLEAYCAELEARAAAGVAACPNERVRLLWVNNGLWFNTGFYRAFEERYGAVFVWSMYSNFFSDGYRKYFDDGVDPLRALAARHISMNEQLHLPGWMSEWIIEQARDYQCDAAVMLVPVGDRLAAFGTKLCAMALERAGIPVLTLTASMVDARLWDNDAMIAKVGQFLEDRVLT